MLLRHADDLEPVGRERADQSKLLGHGLDTGVTDVEVRLGMAGDGAEHRQGVAEIHARGPAVPGIHEDVGAGLDIGEALALPSEHVGARTRGGHDAGIQPCCLLHGVAVAQKYVVRLLGRLLPLAQAGQEDRVALIAHEARVVDSGERGCHLDQFDGIGVSPDSAAVVS